jgi:hypothetical protein
MTLGHFFWDGPLTDMQRLAFLSAKDAGFDVTVWSTQDLDLPEGVKLGNALEIVDPKVLANVRYGSWGSAEGDLHASRALYSDFVRAELLHRYGGWWLDSDCLILRPVEDWEKMAEGKHVVAGQEPSYQPVISLNNAVVHFPNKNLAQVFVQHVYQKIGVGGVFPWAFFGPVALTHIVLTQGRVQDISPVTDFYPIDYAESEKMYSTKAEDKKFCYDRSVDSYCIHWWNSSWKSKNYGDVPPKGSFFDDFFKKYGLSA